MMRASKINLLRTSLLLSALAKASLVSAQTAPVAPNAQPAQEQGVPTGQNGGTAADIVVTAEKRSARLLDVPVPVTALSSDTLVANNQTRLQDYFTQVPGLSLNPLGDGSNNIVIRGLSTGNFGNPTVAVTIDDVPVGGSTALSGGQIYQPDLDPADLQRIEALRGPQGTLYGAASLGGLIKYVTLDPSTSVVSGRIEADVSDTDSGEVGYGVRGSINVPVTPTLAVLASGFSRRTPGYVDNVAAGKSDVNAIDAAGGHLSLLWRPVSGLSVKLGVLYQHTEGKGSSAVATNYYDQPLYGDLTQRFTPNSGAYKMDTLLLTSNVSYDLGALTITSITGYNRDKYNSSADYFSIPGSRLTNYFRTHKFSEELRLSSNPGATLEWLVGGFYTKEHSPTIQIIDAVNPTTAVATANLLYANFPTTYQELSAFGDATYHFTPKFSLQAGVRYAHNRQTFLETDTGPFGDASPGVPTIAAQTSRDSAVTVLVVPQYKLTRDFMVYARFATGYRPGGPNAEASLFNLPGVFGSDTTRNYEIGVKGSVLDRQVTFDFSAYHIDWSDIQLTVVDPGTGFSFFTNGSSARSNGVEGSVELRTRQGLRIAANGSYNVAEFAAAPPPSIRASDGSRLPYAPRFSGSASIYQDIAVGGRWTATLGGAVSYVGSRYGQFPPNATSIRSKFPHYAMLDLRAGIHDDNWTVGLFAQNVTDKRGVLSSIAQRSSRATLTAIYNTNFTQPRTIGLSVARKF